MTDIKIVLDSSADLIKMPGVKFGLAPLTIKTDGRRFVDDRELELEEMVDYLYTYAGKSSTACPNPEDFAFSFCGAENVFCITITSKLSGSYNSARIAKEMHEKKYPGCRVELIDSLSTGPEIVLIAEKIREMAEKDMSFDEIAENIKGYKTELVFVLESMKNLANNGRISRVKASLASFLGIRAIGRASEEGTLEMLAKCRGQDKTVEAVIGYMREYGYAGGRVGIAHCINASGAKALADAIRKEFPEASIDIRQTRGLCSFYAERGGLLIGFERE